MDRSKRAIRTPKRFDDEAFETPPKHQPLAKPVEVPEPTQPPKPEATPVQPKSIIKVKLSKVKPREITPKQTKEVVTKVKEMSKVKESPKPKETLKVKMKPRSRELKPKVEPPVDLSELADASLIKELPPPPPPIKQPKDSSSSNRVKETQSKNKESTLKQHRETQAKPKELSLPPPPILQDREFPIIHRTRTRRPRTPLVFADLIPNVVLPFWDARTAAEDHEDDNVKELVHCQCGILEELGLMIQCETCLTWQHAHCLGIEKDEDVPDGYTCRACSDPKFARESMKWAYDQDWLTKGRMKQFDHDLNPIPEKSVNILHRINQLIGYTLTIHQLIHSLRVKNRILLNAGDDDAELKLFRMQWSANYQHHDGTHFIPTVNNPSSTPASTISVMGETPDPGDIVVESVSDAVLPDIGPLEDVSAILDNTYVPPNHSHSSPNGRPISEEVADQQQQQHQAQFVNNNEATPNDCRSNLRLHIQQTEEFIGIELAHIEEQLGVLEKECALNRSGKHTKLETSLESLKNDLQTMRKYIAFNKQWEY